MSNLSKIWYNNQRDSWYVGFPTPFRVGGDAMTVYEALSLMIGFATLIVLILSSNRK